MLFPRWPKSGASLFLLFALLLALSPLTNADCECGYRVTIPSNDSTAPPQQYTVTDLLETNFANISDISKNTDWVRQEFNVSAQQARGPYGQMTAVDNVESVAGNGLEITLRGAGALVEGMVSGGEINTARRDLLYGSYRSSMKITGVNGTVSAFFFYYNDTQEIDMEFLSRELPSGDNDNETYPVNLVLQSAAAAVVASAAQTPAFATVNLPFDPRAAFHEYRFDFQPGRVVFSADGTVLAEMEGPAVPSHPAHLAINHWSNGNPLWSGGPPPAGQDAVLEVRYVKVYFNSSGDDERAAAYAERCAGGVAEGPRAVCEVPDVTPRNDSAAGWFFSGQKNMTAGQTVSSDSGIEGGDTNGGVGRGVSGWAVLGLTTAATALVLGL